MSSTRASFRGGQRVRTLASLLTFIHTHALSLQLSDAPPPPPTPPTHNQVKPARRRRPSSPCGIGVALRDVCFTPWVYTFIDFTNAHGRLVHMLLVLPVIIIACLTGDLAIAACCLVAGFIVCWSLGFR